ncbi:hypothetical protein PV08_10574 [Exophiala spinifera]|uniref:Bul1 C-terminal domain-containing protein n=1 Tax=Exophiala spinifera TaxID=91928 RepID=A0A0D2BIU1_9EURO|nr:uncharacterized protein PV08_10574 [Exophiala spinifera]KIW11274.1 hypothetical protein PV08_10574 [Exophiala spinifera]
MSPQHIISGEMPSFLSSAPPVPSYTGRSRSLPTNAREGRKGSVLANAIGLRKRNAIDIVLAGDNDFVHSYSTHDEIKGHIEVKFEKDTEFDELAITFEGHGATYVERTAATAPAACRATGQHTFLKVQQPIADYLLPEDSIFRANNTYRIPFTFVVPERLLPYICSHKVDHEEIRHEHIQLPPSLGDASIAGDGHALMDDLAPDMAQICYSVRARVTKYNAVGRLLQLASQIERIRIVPARDEAPPLILSNEPYSDHAMRKETSVRKGLLKLGKTGYLAAETTQPKSLRLPHPKRTRQTEPVASMATINLRFDPRTPDDVPPQLQSITSKLKVYTFFGAAPFKLLPEVRKHDNWSSLYGLYPETVPLSSRNLSTVAWTRHEPGSSVDCRKRSSCSSSSSSSSSTSYTEDSEDVSRRPSTYSSSSSSASSIIPEPSSAYQVNLPFYTASVLVPIALPHSTGSSKPKVFVPTFHSCIVSRTYTVELNVRFRSPGSTIPGGSHVTLKTPIQVSAEGGVPPTGLHESDAAIAAEIEAQFGLYEARALRGEIGDIVDGESPRYDVATAMTPTLMTALGGYHSTLLRGTRHLSLEDSTSISATTRLIQQPGIAAIAPVGLGEGVGTGEVGTGAGGGGGGGGGGVRDESYNAPPEYRAAYSAGNRPGGPRTHSVSP